MGLVLEGILGCQLGDVYSPWVSRVTKIQALTDPSEFIREPASLFDAALLTCQQVN